MRLVAHRGFAALEPENTVGAARRAARRADGVEVDVRRCGSGEPVVVHDPTVDRVSDATGAVAELDAATLRSLSVEGSDEGIPTLASVVDAIPAGVELLLELKESGLAGEALATCVEAGAAVRVQAFDPEVVAEARAAAPGVPRGLLFADDPGAGLDCALALDCTAVGVHHERCDRAFVEAAHDAGLAVYAWTVADARRAAELAALGVDAAISDVPVADPAAATER